MADDLSIVIDVKSNAEVAYRGLDKLNGSVVNSIKAAERLEKNYALLDKALAKKIITVDQYNKGNRELDASIEAVINSTTRSTAATSTNTKATSSAALAAKKLADAQRMAGKETNRFGSVAQQFGYQVGDFFVQIQSGTSALVAFGQQGTQLAGLLPGLAGAVIGIGLSLGTALAGAFIKASGSAKSVTESLSEMNAAFGNFKGYADTALLSIEDLVNGYSRLGNQVRETSLFMAEVELGQAIKSAQESLMKIGEGLPQLRSLSDHMLVLRDNLTSAKLAASDGIIRPDDVLVVQEAMGVLEDEMIKIASGLGLSVEQALKFSSLIENVEIATKAGDMETLSTSAASVVSYIESLGLNLNELPAPMAEALRQLEGMSTAAAEALRQTELLAAAAPDGGWMNSAIGGVNALISRLGIGRQATADLLIAAAGANAANNALPTTPFSSLPNSFMPPVSNTSSGSVGGASSPDALESLLKRLELDKELLGTSKEYQEVMRAIQNSDKKYSDAAIQGAVARLEAINKEKAALEQMESLQQNIADTIGDGLMSMVDGTKSVKDAFRDMARDIIKQLYEVLVIQRLVGNVQSGTGIAGLIGGMFANGGAFSAGRQIQAYANGGVVGGPTYFPMSGGKTGLMGEAGPEAIMPLKRGKGGKLGVSVEGSSGSVNVVNNINVTGGSDPAAIRAEVAKLMPQITSATKSAVIDARRRGGQMKATFQ